MDEKSRALNGIPRAVGRGNRVRWKYDRESSWGRWRKPVGYESAEVADVVGVSPGVAGKCRL